MISKLKTFFFTRRKIIVSSVAVLAGLLLVFAIFIRQRVDKTVVRIPNVQQPTKTEPEKPKTKPSPLTGVEVTAEQAARPVVGMMVENSPEARPQSGIKGAGVVFEAIAEGGITRFLLLYQENLPSLIGPVRSLRPYYLHWALGFDAGIGHVGGSPEALKQIKSLGGRDLDQFANGNSYYRSSDRYAPHNVYTTPDRVDALMKAKGYTSSSFTPFARKADAPAATPTASTISVSISSALFNPTFTYNVATNSYLRAQAGAVHIDRESKAQIEPKVVIVMKTTYGLADSQGHLDIKTVGSGDALIFQDGVETNATWSKADQKAALTFKDVNGADVKLNTGQTWIIALPSDKTVTYQ